MAQRILYISQEISPYLPANQHSTTGHKLPQHAQEKGFEARIFMPKYGAINERRNQLHEVIRLSGLNVVIADTDHPLIIKVASLQPSRMQVYFIDSEDFFVHKSTGALETETHASDNDERAMFFTTGVLETVKKLRWQPGIIHCQGWISALVPLYLRSIYKDDPMYTDSKIVFTLSSTPIAEPLNPEMLNKLKEAGVDADLVGRLADITLDHEALNSLAIDLADALVIGDNDIQDTTLEKARNSGKPLVDFAPEDGAYEAISSLYKEILK